MDKEMIRERAAAEVEFGNLSEIRQEMRELEKRSEEVNAELKRSEDILRFLGRLTQALTVYDRADQTGPLRVRRQSFWVQRQLKLKEYSAHLIGLIMRRVACDASAVLRVSFV